jgi:hypothetical protein
MVEFQFFFDPKKDQASEGNAHGKARDVEQAIDRGLADGAKRGEDVVLEHAFLCIFIR